MTGGRVSLSYAGFYGQPFEDFIRAAAHLKYRSVQLIPDQTPNLIKELGSSRTTALRSTIEELLDNASIHAVFYDINLVSVVPEVQDFALLTIEQCFRLAAELGVKNVTVHPGYMFPGWRSSQTQRETFWRSAARGMTRLDRLANDYGVHAFLENGSYHVTTRRGENPKPLHIGITLEEMDLLLELASDALGVCLDIGKAEASGIPCDTFVNHFGDRIGQIQIGSLTSYRTVISGLERWPLTREPELVLEGGPTLAAEVGALLTFDDSRADTSSP